jgi:hypothetical protein
MRSIAFPFVVNPECIVFEISKEYPGFVKNAQLVMSI